MGVEQQFGDLMLDPLAWRPWEIAEMTDEQILMVVAASARRAKQLNPEKSRPTFDPAKATEDEKRAARYALGRYLGLSDAQIEAQHAARNDPNRVLAPVTYARRPTRATKRRTHSSPPE